MTHWRARSAPPSSVAPSRHRTIHDRRAEGYFSRLSALPEAAAKEAGRGRVAPECAAALEALRVGCAAGGLGETAYAAVTLAVRATATGAAPVIYLSSFDKDRPLLQFGSHQVHRLYPCLLHCSRGPIFAQFVPKKMEEKNLFRTTLGRDWRALKERKQAQQGRDGRTARRHHTGILRRG